MARLRRNDSAPKRRRAAKAPTGTPAGFPFPCDDPMVGQKVSGKDFAGRVVGCAVPPEGGRGPHLYVGGGAVPRGKVTRAAGENTRARESLAERWSGPDHEPAPRGRTTTLRPPPSPAPVLPGTVLEDPWARSQGAPEVSPGTIPPSWLDARSVNVVASTKSLDLSAPLARGAQLSELRAWLTRLADAVVTAIPEGEASVIPPVTIKGRVVATVRVSHPDLVYRGLHAARAILDRPGRLGAGAPESGRPFGSRFGAGAPEARRPFMPRGLLPAPASRPVPMPPPGFSRAAPPSSPVRGLLPAPAATEAPAPKKPSRATTKRKAASKPERQRREAFRSRVGRETLDDLRELVAEFWRVLETLNLADDDARTLRDADVSLPRMQEATRSLALLWRGLERQGNGFAIMLAPTAEALAEAAKVGERHGGYAKKVREKARAHLEELRRHLAATSPDPEAPRPRKPLGLPAPGPRARFERELAGPSAPEWGGGYQPPAPGAQRPSTRFAATEAPDGPRTARRATRSLRAIEVPDAPPPIAAASAGAVLGTAPSARQQEGRKWSPFQAAIFDAVANDSRNLIVMARAGTGKTTTIVQALRHVPAGKRSLLVAFNSAIRDELKRRAPEGVEVRTLHQHGLLCLKKFWGGDLKVGSSAADGDGSRSPDKIRRDNMMRAAGVPWWRSSSNDPSNWNEELKQLIGGKSNLVDLCKSMLALAPEEIRAVQSEFDLLSVKGDPLQWRFQLTDARGNEPRTMDANLVVAWVQRAMAFSQTPPGDDRCISFDDMVFAPAVVPGLQPEQFDFVFVDETQDMNASQLVLVRKSVAPGGRIVIVGDDRQAIYAWRGADSEGMDRMQRELDARVLPLSVSYRVPACAAAEARKVVPDFEVPDGTPEGSCQKITALRMTDLWQNGDFVITRTNKPIEPLVKLAVLSGLKPLALGYGDAMRGVRAILTAAMSSRPKDEGELLDAIQRVLERETANLEREIERKREWYEKKYRRAMYVEGEDERLVELRLNADVARKLVENHHGDLDAVKRRLDEYSVSEEAMERAGDAAVASLLSGRLVISSVHRIKGQEANRTWVLEDTFRFSSSGVKPGPRGEKPSGKKLREEQNLWYVAITRAKNEPGRPGQLFYVVGLKDLLGS